MFRRIRHPYQTYFPDIGATTALLRGFHATTGTHNALDLGGDAESTFDPFGNRKRQKDSAWLPHEMGSKSQVKHYSIIKEPQGNGIVEVRAWLGQSPDGEGTAVEIEREARAQILKLTQLSRRAVEGHAGTPAPLPMWMQSEAQKHYRDVQPQDAGNARPDLHDHDEILMHPIAIMPDVHFGNGTTVGTVIPTFKAVIPSAVGVDIGCGMLALKTSLRHADLCGGSGSGEGGKDQILANLRMAIEIAIPHGRTHNGADTNDAGGWRASVPSDVADIWESELKARFQRIIAKYPTIERSNNVNHLGTLGTGNHFIEICVEEDEDSPDEVTSISKDLAPNRNLQAKHSDIFGISEAVLNEASRAKERELRKQRGGNIWILLHSGSRGVGGKIGSTFIDIAKRDMGNHYSNLPNGDLAYLREGNPHFEDYCEALSWAQDYARWNRELMATRVLKALRATKGIPKGFTTESKAVNCHHNYVERIDITTCQTIPWRFNRTEYDNTRPRQSIREGDTTAIVDHDNPNAVYLTRKGATSARAGELAIVPGSMGARSYIVQGKGNQDSYCSCSHGAGRRHSRGETKRRYTLADHEAAMKGVQCRIDADVIDETPMAYKDIDAVMRAQADLVEVVAVLKQILCVKG